MSWRDYMVNRTTHILRQTDREYMVEMSNKQKNESKDDDFQKVLAAEISKLQGKATNGQQE